MNTFTRTIAALSLLVVVAACGTDSAESGAGSSPESTKSTGSTDSSSQSDVVSVSLQRTGGLMPTTVNLVFAADAAPPKGSTPADVTAVLAAAQAFTASGAEVNPMPKDTCCDRYTYDVTITHADGSSQTYTSLDGLPQPTPFETLLSQLG